MDGLTAGALGGVPRGAGAYALVMRLPSAATLIIGRLGPLAFPAGWYIYAGSALNGLYGRIARHLRPDKRRHWHIDYLSPPADIVQVWCVRRAERLECAWASQLGKLPAVLAYPAPFGCSDCRCVTHLVYSLLWPDLEAARRVLTRGEEIEAAGGPSSSLT